MTDLASIPTPALLVDEAVLSRNVEKMAARARDAGVELWPHFKTHKCLEIARRQRDAGAAGFTVATLHEAEVLAAAGFDRIAFVQPPVGEWRARRLTTLAQRTTGLRITVDSLEAAASLGRLEVDVLWEVDPGTRRTGTAPGEATAEAIAHLLRAHPTLRFRGLLTFAGHAYAAPDADGVLRAALDEEEAMAATLEALAARGIDSPVRSVGSTPTMRFLDRQTTATEARPGNYVYRDATQVALGVATLEQCALSVLGTVTARPTPTRAILDSGSKALAAERLTPLTPDLGIVAGHPQLRVARLYEEHAILEADEPFELETGERLRLIPNHACTAANLHERIVVTRDGEAVAEWPIDARGWG